MPAGAEPARERAQLNDEPVQRPGRQRRLDVVRAAPAPPSAERRPCDPASARQAHALAAARVDGRGRPFSPGARVAPVVARSSRPRATTSPVTASAIFSGSPAGNRITRARRPPFSVMPSRIGPRQIRAQESHPPRPPCTMQNSCATAPSPGGRPRRLLVSSALGAWWRSAFHNRCTPQPLSAAPGSTASTSPSAGSRCITPQNPFRRRLRLLDQPFQKRTVRVGCEVSASEARASRSRPATTSRMRTCSDAAPGR